MQNNSSIENLFRTLRRLTCLLALTLVSQAEAVPVQDSSADREIVWVGVDVVTNDIELESLLSNLTGIHPGDSIKYSDARLKTACDNIRGFFPRSSVSCTGVLMSHGTSLYVVEFSLLTAPEALSRASCKARGEFPAVFKAAIGSIDSESENTLLQGRDENHEFVNVEGYLDSPLPTIHDEIQRAHDIIKNRAVDLSAAVNDCDARNRVIAYRLLNYLGNPDFAVSLASNSIDDPDVNVRNSTMRLLSSFSAFIDVDTGRKIARISCENLKKVSFLDRNKGVSLIWGMLQKNVVGPDQLDTECLTRIRRFAESSQSDQIGAFSRLIVKKVSVEATK